MKAVQITRHGHVDAVKIVDIEKPKAGKGNVLIKVYASCINPIDIKIREGAVPNIAFPFTLGSDVAGVVTEIGEGVESIAIGNKVYGQAIALAGASGAFAEFASVPAGMLAKMPKNLDFNHAGAAVLTGTSAVQALLEHIKLQPGQKILIHGAAGGIGTIAIQIAKHIGAYIATTATGEGIDYVKKLGASEVIDYKHQAFDEMLQGYDAVFDTVGGQTYEKSFKILKRGGIIVSMVAAQNQKLADEHGVSAISQWTKVTTRNLNMLTKFIEDSIVRVHIDKIYSFDRIKEAFEEQESGNVNGKIVIAIH